MRLLRNLAPSAPLSVQIRFAATRALYLSDEADELNFEARSGFQEWEVETQICLYQEVRTASNFVNIGSYSGFYCVLAGLANPSLNIWAFEPNIFIHPNWHRNIKANHLQGRAKLFPHAVSRENGVGLLRVPSNLMGHQSTTAHLLTRGDRDLAAQASPVHTVRLDKFPIDYRNAVFLVDAEGSEMEILEGMVEVLDRFKPSIIMEALGESRYHNQMVFFHRFGYSPHKVMGADRYFNVLWRAEKPQRA